MHNKKLQMNIFAGLMIAIGIVLSSILSISYPPNSTIIRFGIGYLPLIIISITLGPKMGLYSAIIQDILGYVVYIWIFGFPAGPFFPGFTFNAILFGVIPFVFYNIKVNNKKIFSYLNFGLLILFLGAAIWGLIKIDWIISLVESRLDEGMAFSSTVLYLILLIGLIGIVSTLIFVYIKRKEDDKAQRIIFTVMVLQIVVTLLLTPLWVSILYKIPFLPQLPLRIIKMPLEIFIYSILLIRLVDFFENKII
ncbi:MAG: folate family ECF transporter S component [Candidatus Izimaplasma sp.]|nr:folate family ECF transporter S component [Candidatus Izimaplasma bacterium]